MKFAHFKFLRFDETRAIGSILAMTLVLAVSIAVDLTSVPSKAKPAAAALGARAQA